MHTYNSIFHSILNTSSPQPDDKQDGAQSIHHIAFYMFEFRVKVTYDWSTGLYLCRPHC